MAKSPGIATVLLLVQLWPTVAAADHNCMNDYYRTKPADCVDSILAQPRQAEAGSTSASTGIVGFLAQLFNTSPAEKQRILAGASSQPFKITELLALYRAGLPDDAREFARQNGLERILERMEKPPPLSKVRPLQNPAENDLLIGAYMASGDTVLIERILENFSSADDGMVGDAMRLGFMNGKFGPGFTPKDRGNVMAPAACEKYQCKTDRAKFLRVLTLSSAFWALQSLGRQDDGIKKTFAGFFERDARLKSLLAAEGAAFGNYLTALAMFSVFKPNQARDADQTVASMNKAALAYENLEPANKVFEHIETYVKGEKKKQ